MQRRADYKKAENMAIGGQIEPKLVNLSLVRDAKISSATGS